MRLRFVEFRPDNIAGLCHIAGWRAGPHTLFAELQVDYVVRPERFDDVRFDQTARPAKGVTTRSDETTSARSNPNSENLMTVIPTRPAGAALDLTGISRPGPIEGTALAPRILSP